MQIGEFVTLEKLQEEISGWLPLIRERCGYGGSWWDCNRNEPSAKGLFLKIEFSKKFEYWVLQDSGVYSRNEHFHSRAKNKYTFIFKGIDWTNKTLNDEVARQFKEFKVKAKIIDLEKDFV